LQVRGWVVGNPDIENEERRLRNLPRISASTDHNRQLVMARCNSSWLAGWNIWANRGT